MRQKLVGKEILFVVDYKVPATGREYGIIYLGKGMQSFFIFSRMKSLMVFDLDTSGENVAESLVAEGLVDVRQVTSNRPAE